MAKKTEAEKNVERQNIRNAHEPRIKAMQGQQNALVTKIEHLTMQKIFLDSNVQTMNEDYLDFKKVVDVATAKYADYDELKGNFMKYVKSETEAITGHGDTCIGKMNHAGMAAQVAQYELDRKIENLRSDLTKLLGNISDAQISFQNALNSIV